MTERYKTNGETTAAEALDSSETAVDVTSASALRASYTTGDTYRILVDDEVMIVTAEATNTLTVTRGAEGTSAATHSNGATVTQVVTAGALDQIKLDANLVGISGNSGQTTLAADFNLESASGTYDDIGVGVSLPVAGTYRLEARVEGDIKILTGTEAYILGKLRNTTDSADVSAVTAITYCAVSATVWQTWSTWSVFVTVAGAKTIKIYCQRGFDGSIDTGASLIRGISSSLGNTYLSFQRVA